MKGDQLEALSFLSNVSDDQDLCEEAQEVFDGLYETWAADEEDDLEPTTEIYNLLISVYANCGDLKTADGILSKMEENAGDGMPSTDVETYTTIMDGFGKLKNLKKAEEVFERLRSQNDIDISIDAYNAMFRLWKKSGDWNAPQKAEDLLSDILSASAPSADTETFCLVMECFSRNTPRKKMPSVPKKVEELIALMEEELENGNDSVNPTHRDIINIQMKALGLSRKKQAAADAVALLFGMIQRYQGNRNEDERPNAASFINAINARKYDKSKESAERASELMGVLENFHDMEVKEAGDEDEDLDDLKPDARVHNAVMNIWSRSEAPDKAAETKNLFDKLQSLHEETSDSDYAPNLRSYNYVISACAFTKGSEKECNAAMNLMVGLFNTMGKSDDEGVKPNHVTFGMVLKGCNNLIPTTQKKEKFIEKLFRKACRDGCVSDFVINALFEASSTSFVEDLLGSKVEDGIQIPEEWTKMLTD